MLVLLLLGNISFGKLLQATAAAANWCYPSNGFDSCPTTANSVLVTISTKGINERDNTNSEIYYYLFAKM